MFQAKGPNLQKLLWAAYAHKHLHVWALNPHLFTSKEHWHHLPLKRPLGLQLEEVYLGLVWDVLLELYGGEVCTESSLTAWLKPENPSLHEHQSHLKI